MKIEENLLLTFPIVDEYPVELILSSENERNLGEMFLQIGLLNVPLLISDKN